MADALLEIVLENLLSFAQDQLSTFWGVNQEAEKLTRYLRAARSVLQDAEQWQKTSNNVKDWLQKLSDAAYVLDDILDEWSIQSNELQFEGQNSGSSSNIACLTRFHPNNILSRGDIGKRMKKITQRFHDIDEERRMFGFHSLEVIEWQGQPEDDEWRQTTSVVTEPKVYGRDQDGEQIVEFLLRHASSNEDLSIYPIVGMGGLGKTTLVQRVFNDERVSKHFDLKIWVCVSDDFSTMKILQSVIESATGQNPNLSTLESMQKKVQEVLQSKRYLLVLDDVWSEDPTKWEMLKNILQCRSGRNGASILVTTRLESVASIMGTVSVHHLFPLSEDDSWSLFKHHAFGPNKEGCPELVSIGREIVKKCAGLPLAAKVLGSLLRFKSDENEWVGVKESIPENDIIMSILRLSYFNLKLSLRRCFSFCAIFPKDEEIMKEDLIHLWMANGFISSRGSLEVERVGHEVWNELCRRSLFQEVKTDGYGQITSFKMHDLVHDLAQSIMGEECVVFENASLTNLPSRVHHIGCLKYFNLKGNSNMLAFKKVESLRTFLFYSRGSLSVLPSVSSLRALRTRSSQLSALKNFTHLRYLAFWHSRIRTLPKSVCMLQKLQILKLEYCTELSFLPKHLTRLQDLRHLVIKGCRSLRVMPAKIGMLKHLKTLSTFIVDSKAGFGLAELRDLQLGGELHIEGLEHVTNERDAKEANLIGKKDLNHLHLSWGENADSQATNAEPERILGALEPPSNLKSFDITGYPGIQLASWMRNTSILKGLVDVTLYGCRNCQQLPPLGKLPHLTSLLVSKMEDVKHMDFESYDPVAEKAFPSLKKLLLVNLPNLERMLEAEGVEMLPLLFKLTILSVPKLTLPCLPSVEYLTAVGNEHETSFREWNVQSMHRLKTLLILGFRQLKVLPDEFGSLSALRQLIINSSDELESFPEHVLQGTTSLRTLEFNDRRKLKLSEGVGHLTCLEHLRIGGCPMLVALPSNMNQLAALRHVEFMGSTLPQGLERIPSLESLTLSDLKTDSLPEWLGDMASLQQLAIFGCRQLGSLPSSFRHLTNLHQLSIDSCPQLQKRCKEGTGEDWPKIEHVPQIEIYPVQSCKGGRFVRQMRKVIDKAFDKQRS